MNAPLESGRRETTLIVQLHPDLVIPSPFQPRIDFDHVELEALANSICKHGQQEPIHVRRLADGKLELLSGERRLRACKLRAIMVDAIIKEGISDEEARKQVYLANAGRVNLSALEEADAMAADAAGGATQTAIAALYGRSLATVRTRLALANLIPAARRALQDGWITLGVAAEIGTLVESSQVQMLRLQEALRAQVGYAPKVVEPDVPVAAAAPRTRALKLPVGPDRPDVLLRQLERATRKLRACSHIDDRLRPQLQRVIGDLQALNSS